MGRWGVLAALMVLAAPAMAAPKAGTLGLAAAAGTPTSVFGGEYYLDAKTYLRGTIGFSLAGTTTSQNLSPASHYTVFSPSLTVGALYMTEGKVTGPVTWAWGGGLGLGWDYSERSDSSGKEIWPVLDLSLTGAVDVKYWLAPGVALYVEPTLVLAWEPVRGDTVTDSSGTKITDDNVSTLSLGTATSFGVVLYLN